MNAKRAGLLTFSLVSLMAATPALGQDTRASSDNGAAVGTFSLQVENDLFGSGTDRNFTNGIRISWFSAENAVPDFIVDTARAVGFADQGTALRYGLSFGQNMYTPEDISRATPDSTDRPYAGWLYGALGLTAEDKDGFDTLDTFELSLGVVGPAALAKETQKFVHNIIDATDPRGWDSQLDNEPAVLLTVQRKWRALWQPEFLPLEADVTPHLGAAVGNVAIHGGGGLTLRLGQDLPSDYGPPRVRPSLPGTTHFKPGGKFGWYIFGGVEGRVVGRDMFLDGNTFSDGPSVEKRRTVTDIQAGVVFTFPYARVGYTYVYRTTEFKSQRSPHGFGAVSVGVRF